MSAKHTPGPWSKLPSGEAKFIPLRAHHCEKLGFCIGFVNYDINDGHGSIPAANARLIAAAPDLLDALQAFPGFTDDATAGDAWLEKMRAAIAKATG
jgi:hypothetical protein